jgi:hypothetical protein
VPEFKRFFFIRYCCPVWFLSREINPDILQVAVSKVYSLDCEFPSYGTGWRPRTCPTSRWPAWGSWTWAVGPASSQNHWVSRASYQRFTRWLVCLQVCIYNFLMAITKLCENTFSPGVKLDKFSCFLWQRKINGSFFYWHWFVTRESK